MHLLHRVPQLDTEPAQDIALPSIVLGVHPSLHLLVVDNAHAKGLGRVGRVERRPSLLDLREQLLPVCEVLAESVEYVFGLEIPE